MILDYKENLELPEKAVEENFESRMALARLAEGLFWLNSEISRLETEARRLASNDKDERGNVPIIVPAGGLLQKFPEGVLSNVFVWYAISACNYAQLIGWLVFRDKDKQNAYTKRVMPRIYRYRNKIAAHLAITAPYKTDNVADLELSLLTNVTFVQGYFMAAAMEPIIKTEESQIKVTEKMGWSLTVAHTRLTQRWWPKGHEKSSPSIKLGPGQTKNFEFDWSYLTEDVV